MTTIGTIKHGLGEAMGGRLNVRVGEKADLGDALRLINTAVLSSVFKEMAIGAFEPNGRLAGILRETCSSFISKKLGVIDQETSKSWALELAAEFHSRLAPEAFYDTARRVNERSVISNSLSFTNPKELKEIIDTGLSVVSTLDGKVAAYMCARELDFTMAGKKVVEITYGLTGPEFRDSGRKDGRLDLQHRNRFALLNLIAERYGDDAIILSISRQPSVARALDISGFIELYGITEDKNAGKGVERHLTFAEQSKIYSLLNGREWLGDGKGLQLFIDEMRQALFDGAIWNRKWNARITTSGEWRRLNFASAEDYIARIADDKANGGRTDAAERSRALERTDARKA